MEAIRISEQNVELVRRGLASVNAGDWESFFRDAAPNWELDWSRGRAGEVPGVYRGEEAQRRAIDFVDSWQSFRTDPHEFIEVGEHVIVPTTEYYVGRDGIEVQARNTWTVTIRDGMVVRTRLYQDKQEALEALGLKG
jgi:ketosteroid isomerase-like protein